MVNAFFIMILLYLGPIAAYVLFFYHRKIITTLYDFVRHKEVRFFLLSIARFSINIGASAASLVVIAYFIPQVGVTTLMLYKVGISGIITSISGYYIERFLK